MEIRDLSIFLRKKDKGVTWSRRKAVENELFAGKTGKKRTKFRLFFVKKNFALRNAPPAAVSLATDYIAVAVRSPRGFYSIRNEISYRVKITPVGSPTGVYAIRSVFMC